MIVNYRAYLQGRMMSKGIRKSEATALRLKMAAIELLDQPGYHAMTIDQICERGEVAKGTFYLHFESKQALTLATLEEFVGLQAALAPEPDEKAHLLENIRALVRWISDFFRENTALQRALMQLADTLPAVTDVWQRHTRSLAERVVRLVRKELNTDEITEDQMYFTVYLLGNMLDQLLYAACAVHRQAHLERVAGTPEHTVEMVSLLWYRALCADNPPANLLHTSAPLLSLSRKRKK